MKFDRKLLLIIFTVFFLISLIWDFSLYFLPNHTTQWNFLYLALYSIMDLLGGIMAIAYGMSYGLRSNLGKMLLCFGLGILLFAIGNGVFLYYYTVLQAALPYPSWADAVFVIDCLFTTAGMFYLIRMYQSLVNKKLIIISFTIALIAFIVVFGFIVKPDLSAGVPLVVKFLNIYYPLTDVISITFGVMVLFIGGGRFYTYFYLLAIRFLFTAIGDFIYTFRATEGTYWVGDIPDLMYTIAGYLLIVGLIEIIFNLKQPAVEVDKQNEIS